MAFYGQNLRSWATGDGDYAAAGIDHDYARLDLPLRLLRSYVRGQ
jgi:hypothetical protein